MTQTIERMFVTQDVDKTFNMIEDEDGDSYGHRDGPEFIEEVNRWLIHACGATVPDDLFALNQPVEHLWACQEEGQYERFCIHTGPNDETFPVTRLMI